MGIDLPPRAPCSEISTCRWRVWPSGKIVRNSLRSASLQVKRTPPCPGTLTIGRGMEPLATESRSVLQALLAAAVGGFSSGSRSPSSPSILLSIVSMTAGVNGVVRKLIQSEASVFMSRWAGHWATDDVPLRIMRWSAGGRGVSGGAVCGSCSQFNCCSGGASVTLRISLFPLDLSFEQHSKGVRVYLLPALPDAY